ncbi:hypothetical protein AB834_05015 [PVC group bacterium (ex Bugula neritina AB1)]|nr:hypothetical protein AB834_05015 [PVC group bacterium (ex Bugula neritina AB1)]
MSNIPNLYLKQIELGPMNNYIYIIGNSESREVMIVDPAWEPEHLKTILKNENLSIKGLLITHGHPDHCNGVSGILDSYDVPVYVSKAEASFYKPIGENIKNVLPGDILSLGNINIECIHTPGHTPGSQCFKVGENLISGDTLFLDGCGRCDLPGGNVEDLYKSLYNIILKLPFSTTLYPGHNYHHLKKDTLENQSETNGYLQCSNMHEFVHTRMKR